MSRAESAPKSTDPEEDPAGAAKGGDAADKPEGGPFILILFLIALIPGFLVGYLLGAGPAAIVGAFAALFTLVATLGGPLRPGLRLAAVLAPAMVFAAVVPRVVGEVSKPAGIALVVVVVFGASLVPLLGARFTTAGASIAMVALFSYGIALTGPAGPWQLVLAAVSGLVLAVLLRVVFGVSDPSKQTREKVAATLDADDAGLGDAFDLWMADGRPRWLGAALGGASRYRVAVHAVEALDRRDGDETAAVEALRERAAELADRIREKKPAEEPLAPFVPPAGLPAAEAAVVAEAAAGLEVVERAEAERDTTRVDVDLDRHDRLHLVTLKPGIRLRSVQLRHALRAAIGALLILLVTSYLPPGDPLVATTLLTTFSIMAASWRETFDKARPRIIGVLCGGLAAAVIVLFLPSNWLVVIALVSLVVGLWNVISRPALGYSFMVLVSVGFNSGLRHLDPVATLLEYVVLILIAVLIGTVVGFAVIPGLRPAPLRERIREARATTVRALRAGGSSRDPAVAALQRTAREARRELVPDRDRLTDEQLADLDRLRVALEDLAVLGAGVARTGDPRFSEVLDVLGEGPEPTTDELVPARPEAVDPGPQAALSSAVVGLAEQVRDVERRLVPGLPG
jgi:uncharacterized membrane protein YccC